MEGIFPPSPACKGRIQHASGGRELCWPQAGQPRSQEGMGVGLGAWIPSLPHRQRRGSRSLKERLKSPKPASGRLLESSQSTESAGPCESWLQPTWCNCSVLPERQLRTLPARSGPVQIFDSQAQNGWNGCLRGSRQDKGHRPPGESPDRRRLSSADESATEERETNPSRWMKWNCHMKDIASEEDLRPLISACRKINEQHCQCRCPA